MRIKKIIKQALKEDIGKKDITTQLLIPADRYVQAALLTNEDCIVCGLGLANSVFKTMDNRISFKPLVKEGVFVKRGKPLALIEGKARAILTAERVALNFLSLLSGIATKTNTFVKKVKPYRVKIMDTRKTIPLIRQLQKYAVRVGGGYNHRMGLDEMILIKDNHLKIQNAKCKIKNSVEGISKKLLRKPKIEIEVKNINEFREALELKPDIIMLDNMNIKDIRKAVRLRNRLWTKDYGLRTKLEASGGLGLKNVRKIAATGVEMISIGALTHSVKSIDMSLEILK